MVMVEIFDLKMTVLDLRMSFLTLSMTSNDHDIHAIRIGIKFEIEKYVYQVYLAVFQISDPKMTFFDPLDDLG